MTNLKDFKKEMQSLALDELKEIIIFIPKLLLIPILLLVIIYDFIYWFIRLGISKK